MSITAMIQRLTLTLLLISGWVEACNSFGGRSSAKGEILGGGSYAVQLGQAYDRNRHLTINRSCVTGKPIILPNLTGQIRYERNMSADQLASVASGSLNAAVDFGIVAGSAGTDFAIRNAADTLSDNYSLYYRFSGHSVAFVPDSLKVSTDGDHMLSAYKNKLDRKCGSEFVHQIDLGGVFIAILKLSFLNEEAKTKVNGSLAMKVDVAVASVALEGDLSALDEKTKQSTVLSVEVFQLGGDPSQIASLVDPQFGSCDLTHPEPCLGAFIAAIDYAKSLPMQFRSDGDNVVLRFLTEKYADSNENLSVLGGSGQTGADEPQAMSDNGKYAAELKNYFRANFLLEYFPFLLSDDQKQSIGTVGNMALKNSVLLGGNQAACVPSASETCPASMQQYSYDISVLQVAQ